MENTKETWDDCGAKAKFEQNHVLKQKSMALEGNGIQEVSVPTLWPRSDMRLTLCDGSGKEPKRQKRSTRGWKKN